MMGFKKTVADVPTIGKKYIPIEKIGSGAFGDTFSARCVKTGTRVALKVENEKARQLEREAEIYRDIEGGVAVPRVHWFGTEGNYNFLAMDLLGPSLEEAFELCSRRFTLKTVLMLADQMITRVEYVHSKNYIHRDMKPANFLLGTGADCNTCYLVDLGLAKRYRDASIAHIELTDYNNLIGTARFASINAHLGLTLSRRDDLESLAYVLIYFLRGALPWMGINAETKKQKYGKMGQKKLETPVADLCQGLPAEFQIFVDYVRGLRFDEQPDYMFLRQLLRLLFHTMNYKLDNKFDWCKFKGHLGFMTSEKNVEEEEESSA